MLQRRNRSIVFYAFDLLYLNGYDLRRCEIENGSGSLRKSFVPTTSFPLADAFPDQGEQLLNRRPAARAGRYRRETFRLNV